MKSCEIKGRGHEMAAMMLITRLNMALCIIEICYQLTSFAAISWPPPLISQLFQGFEDRTHFIQLGCFCVDFTSFCILNTHKANHKLSLRFIFTYIIYIIVFLIYR